MKTQRLFFVLVILAAVGAMFLGYRGYRWRQIQQKRKELFVYFQSKSRLMRKIPSDAVVYINLFDFRRVHSSLQKTEFYQVFAHWFDTGLSSRQKANPLLGSMMEKTVLDVIGQEFAIGLLPSGSPQPDFFAAAELTPGSDFLLQLALASAKHAEKIERDDRVVYGFATKDRRYPEIFVTVDPDFAYASNNVSRLVQALKTAEGGPSFLRELSVEAIPEDTFLFVQAKEPKVSAFLYGNERTYHLIAQTGSSALGPIPVLGKLDSTILKVQTNGTAIFKQPAASFLLQSVDRKPLSTLILGFQDAEDARVYDESLLQHLQPANPVSTDPLPQPEPFKAGNADCIEAPEKGIVCRSQNVVLLTQNSGLLAAAPLAPMIGQSALPLTLKVEYTPDPIDDYLIRVQQKDWSLFPDGSVFYFLSCVKSVTGGIDSANDELIAEIY